MTGPTLIDIDALLGRFPRRDVGSGTVAALLSTMDRVGVAEAVVGHYQSWLHDPALGNRLVLEQIAGNPRLHPCWAMLPDTCGELGTPAEFVSAAHQAGVVAVRAFPLDHGYDLAGADTTSMLEALEGARLPLLVDAMQTSWSAIEAAARSHPALQIIACRGSYRTLRRIAGVLERTDNVHLSLGNLSSHCGLEWLVGRFGTERIFFGTAAPEHDMAEAVTRLLWSELADEDVAAIGSGNLHTLLARRRQAA